MEHESGERHFAPLLAHLPRDLERIRIVSVVHEGIAMRLARALRRVTRLDATFVETQRSAAGVRCGYRQPWRLGADRWAAIIGAHHYFAKPRDICVVDVGTAMTLDFVDRDGRHHGGSIVPAPATMVRTLLQGTSGIDERAATAASRDRSVFARGTRDAIVHGSGNAAAALVERFHEDARRALRRRPTVLLTGGGASDLAAYLRLPHETVPDLVLRGLAALG